MSQEVRGLLVACSLFFAALGLVAGGIFLRGARRRQARAHPTTLPRGTLFVFMEAILIFSAATTAIGLRLDPPLEDLVHWIMLASGIVSFAASLFFLHQMFPWLFRRMW